MRAFVGLDLPDELLGLLVRLQGGMRGGRIVPEENLHLTLAFLDDQPEDRLEDLHLELEAIWAGALDLRLDGLGSFGGGRPRLAFAALAEDPDLAELRRLVRRAASRSGIRLPEERFTPHITLMRCRAQDRPVLPVFEDRPDFTARSFSLFRSTLDPEGARYERLATYPLTG